MPRKIRQGLPDAVPLTIIGRLAVDRSLQGQRLGAGLLKDALGRALEAAQIVGTRAILVHAIDQPAAAYYARFGFIAFPSESHTLSLPIETVRALFEREPLV